MSPLTTQIVGSYVKPDWLIHNGQEHAAPDQWWRPQPEVLKQAIDDAALLAIWDQERAGLDIVTDGEVRRQHYDRHFVLGLGGISLERLQQKTFTTELTTNTRAQGLDDLWQDFTLSPTITGPLTWQHSPILDEFRFARAHARRPLKVPVVGPMTLYDRLADEHYDRPEDGILAMADALNQELLALQAEGAQHFLVAEPALHFKLTRARDIGIEAMSRLVAGVHRPVTVHVCYGYAKYAEAKAANPGYAEVVRLISAMPVQAMSLEYEQPGHGPDLLRHVTDTDVHLGLLNLGTRDIETPDHIAARLREALTVLPPDRLHPCSDCGMWFLPRPVARAKIDALVRGTNIVRRELGLPIPDHANLPDRFTEPEFTS